MKKLDEIRFKIKKGKFPKDFPEFGGANLIITKDNNRQHYEQDVIVYSEHAPALSWLVVELMKVYDSEIDYFNKYEFYPSIGELIKQTLTKQEYLFEVMLHVIDEIEKEWGTK